MSKLFWRKLRRIITKEKFALAPVSVQLVAIFIASASVIILLSPFLGDLSTSYRLFADPSSYANAKGPLQLTVGLVQVLIGLVLFSFIISVMSAALTTLIDNIKSGSLPYLKKGHIIIVNFNVKLPLILDQLNIRAKDRGEFEDVILLFSDPELVKFFRTQYQNERWSNLDVFVRQGDVLAFKTFDRLSVFNASGIVILLPDHIENDFESDNFNLKILTTLSNNHTFFQHLSERHINRRPLKCSIELSNNPDCARIAKELTSTESGSFFAVITPGDVIGSILSRAKVDVVYYKVFFEILSFDGSTVHFVDPKRFSPTGKLTGKSFKELLLSFEGGTLLGFSGVTNEGRFQINLCPFGETLKSTDWLLFLTTNIKEIKYTPVSMSVEIQKSPHILAPNEVASKNICVIGDAWPLGNIHDFIDVSSLAALEEASFVFKNPSDYFEPKFLKRLHEGNFDNIIINLNDELGFRLTMLLISSNQKNQAFLSKIVSILNDPVTEQLLSRKVLRSNTVLSHKLSARYIAQIAFQKNLDLLFSELAYAEGAEFQLLEVGRHIPKELLTDANTIRALLTAHRMVYVGTVDMEQNINLEATSFEGIKQILVLIHHNDTLNITDIK
ncbi:hypothetical protein SAMN00777080_3228 [Aquiflexum balticum DSM 16537]|uniref:Castor and Pollux, part of voltage-gated ion channel n=1 Tax=Aquiflexum balticum DSM 16537 TaxID=758820 RepID=A0A1W2H774_9BACT|nr:hypothetical protein [Aquiflexum balticum]SMD44604.1 hypothetical protein SAMN00777080_3228 [Aquiflexum balticum DSM 16537]